MINICIFRNPITKSISDKEKPEIIRRVADCQSKFFKTKVRESQKRLANFEIKRGMKYE